MEFIDKHSKKKIVRTVAYGDQEFTRWELEILHTPLIQRLYNLKQLGFADRVFPDAVHSRFNHILGVAELSERMASRLKIWLTNNADTEFEYASDSRDELDGLVHRITGKDLAERVEKALPALRLVALLHDVTHVAFGHTLEDEIGVLAEKHDDPERQTRFFNALTAQLLFLWVLELRLQSPRMSTLEDLEELRVNPVEIENWVEQLAEDLSRDHKRRQFLASRLRELEQAFRLLQYLEFVHESRARSVPARAPLLISDVAAKLDGTRPAVDFSLHRDTFLIDMVGNTICADLLDYGLRDAANSGLRVQFDLRLIRYLTVVSVQGDLSPTRKPCIRLAIQFFTDKMRHDVLSEMSSILRARYLLHERVLFHPTKCSAGAMLGTAVQLLGIKRLSVYAQTLGDQEFIRYLRNIGSYISTACDQQLFTYPVNSFDLQSPGAHQLVPDLEQCWETLWDGKTEASATKKEMETVQERVDGSRLLLWKLSARRFHKLAFRLRAGLESSGAESDRSLAEKYTQPEERFKLERRVERICCLPLGSIVIHCPRWTTSMKVAEVLVVGADLKQARRLRDVTEIFHARQMKPYQDEIRAVEDMYKSIWQLHVYLDECWFHKQPVVEWVLERELKFENDVLLREELRHQRADGPYHLMANELKDEIAFSHLPHVILRVDREISTGSLARMRQQQDMATELRRIIREVAASSEGGAPSQLSFPET